MPDREAKALSFLAADWLLARAGERAIFEYYRLRQSTDDWKDAFEGAFGITIDEFYQEFAEYRAAGLVALIPRRGDAALDDARKDVTAVDRGGRDRGSPMRRRLP